MNRIKCYAWVLLLCCACLLSGCGREKDTESVRVFVAPYEKNTYPTVTVQKGDLAPLLKIELRPEKKTQIDYRAEDNSLSVDKVYVTEGTAVKKGDVLVRFASASLEEQLTETRQQLEQNNMLIAHYEQLGAIDGSNDYADDIKSIQEDNAVLALRCDEISGKLAAYSIVAKEDGVITYVNDILYYGLNENTGTLLTEECGSDDFSVRVTDDYPFCEDEEYEAKCGIAVYRVRLREIADNGDGSRQLTFTPLSDMSGIKTTEAAAITIEKPVIADVVYVDEAAVFRKNGDCFVYCVDEAGYRHAVEVTVGETVDGNTIITSGLSGGEQVTMY